jgi:Asp-tRNA(Asn)/Glu-tRNA(Gln) amidotransferase A subunit family amidase
MFSPDSPARPLNIAGFQLARQERDLSQSEVIELCKDHIDELDLQFGAFADVQRDEGPCLSTEYAGPLAGIPIAIKANRDTTGLLVEHGSLALSGRRPTRDHPFVSRIRAAGAAIVGTTVCSEFSLLPSCEPLTSGPVLNPRSIQIGTGGSSGGSAAAVAAGLVPIAHGNDAGGSLRIPAAACGLTSIVTFDSSTAPGEGFITSRVDDALLAISAVGCSYTQSDQENFRAAVITNAVDGRLADVKERTEVENAAAALIGWAVDTPPPLPTHPYLDHRFAATAPPAARRINELLQHHTRMQGYSKVELETYTQEFLEHARRVPGDHHLRARELSEEWTRHYTQHYESYEVLISPIALPPAPGVLNGAFGLKELGALTGSLIAFTWPVNALRWPCISIGSVQFTARPERWGSLITAAKLFEQHIFRSKSTSH